MAHTADDDRVHAMFKARAWAFPAVMALLCLPGAACAQTPAQTPTQAPAQGLPQRIQELGKRVGEALDAARSGAQQALDAARSGAQQALDAAGVQMPVLGDPPGVLPAPSGQLNAGQALTLSDAWQAALLNDPSLRAARAALAVGRERIPQARAQLLPNVQMGFSRSNNQLDRIQVNSLNQPLTTTDRYPSSNETLSLRQPLLRPQQWAQLRQAGFQVNDAEANLARETQNLAVRLSGAYLEAMLARDQVALVRAQQRFLTLQLDAASKAFERGAGTRTDVDDARARLDVNRAQELEVLQAVDFTRRQLEVIVNRPVGDLATLDPARLVLEELQPPQVQDWVNLAYDSSPELRSLAAQKSAAEEEIAKARANHLPTLDFNAQLQRSRSENALSPQSQYNVASFGVQLNVPIYAGGYVNSTIRQAGAEVERIAEVLEATRLDLGVRLHREFRGVTEGRAKVRALEVAVRSADVALDSARKSFTAGTRTMVDILNAEQQRMAVMRDLSQSRYQMLASMVRLRALAGMADDSLMVAVSSSFVP